jgi:hypothetical protein
VWSVVQPDTEMVFSRNPENLWESLQTKKRQLTADAAQRHLQPAAGDSALLVALAE